MNSRFFPSSLGGGWYMISEITMPVRRLEGPAVSAEESWEPSNSLEKSNTPKTASVNLNLMNANDVLSGVATVFQAKNFLILAVGCNDWPLAGVKPIGLKEIPLMNADTCRTGWRRWVEIQPEDHQNILWISGLG